MRVFHTKFPSCQCATIEWSFLAFSFFFFFKENWMIQTIWWNRILLYGFVITNFQNCSCKFSSIFVHGQCIGFDAFNIISFHTNWTVFNAKHAIFSMHIEYVSFWNGNVSGIEKWMRFRLYATKTHYLINATNAQIMVKICMLKHHTQCTCTIHINCIGAIQLSCKYQMHLMWKLIFDFRYLHLKIVFNWHISCKISPKIIMVPVYLHS